MPPRTTQKSSRPRVSDRIMVGTLANTSACEASGPKAPNHRLMKPSSRNHQLGWSRWNLRRAQGSQDTNPSATKTGLDARDNIHLPSEGMGKIFFLTSPLIGQLRTSQERILSGRGPTRWPALAISFLGVRVS